MKQLQSHYLKLLHKWNNELYDCTMDAVNPSYKAYKRAYLMSEYYQYLLAVVMDAGRKPTEQDKRIAMKDAHFAYTNKIKEVK
jgi:hypothetical protein